MYREIESSKQRKLSHTPSINFLGANANSSQAQNFVDYNANKIPNPGVLDLTRTGITPQQVVNHFISAAR